MNQTALDLDTLPADHGDRTGFELGWDHAHHGLVPAPELLLQGTPVSQGWLAGKAVFGRRTLVSTRFTRQWLLLRTDAWLRGIPFNREHITPQTLAQIEPACCPITRQRLGGAEHALTVELLQPSLGYVAGNLVVMGAAAAAARAGCGFGQAIAHVRAGVELQGLDSAAWWRMAALLSLATPLSHLDAARLPLRVLPPNGVRAVNPAQRLQILLTMQLGSPGWSGRVRTFAALLADAGLRHDFNLFIGALAPRLLEASADADALALRHTLEDAWADARVNRRWQHFIVQISVAETETLLVRATSMWMPSPSRSRKLSQRATAGSPPKKSSQTMGASVV